MGDVSSWFSHSRIEALAESGGWGLSFRADGTVSALILKTHKPKMASSCRLTASLVDLSGPALAAVAHVMPGSGTSLRFRHGKSS